jgi:hypothetical protein
VYGQGAIGCTLLPLPTKVNYWCTRALTYLSLVGNTQLVDNFGVSSLPLLYYEALSICKDDLVSFGMPQSVCL